MLQAVLCIGGFGLEPCDALPQVVAFGGARMSASRFETVCGKGDAKKWKSSIWLEGPDGSQQQVQG